MRKRQRKVRDPLLKALIKALSEDRVTDGASARRIYSKMVRLWKEVERVLYVSRKTLQK